MRRTGLAALIVLGLSALGCNQCGERRPLFPRLHDRLTRDDEPARTGAAKRPGDSEPCNNGTPVGRGNGFGDPIGYPTSGGVVYGPTYPTVPGGNPYPAQPRNDELPQPGYIQPPGVPANPYAQPRSIEGMKLQPKSGGTMTGESKK